MNEDEHRAVFTPSVSYTVRSPSFEENTAVSLSSVRATNEFIEQVDGKLAEVEDKLATMKIEGSMSNEQ